MRGLALKPNPTDLRASSHVGGKWFRRLIYIIVHTALPWL